MNRSRLLPLLLLGLAACQTPAPEPAGPPAAATTPAAVSDTGADPAAAARSEIAALTASYQAAARTGDVATILALHTDDAVLHPAGKPVVRGRAALDAFLTAAHTAPAEISYHTVDIVVAEAGDLAYEVGTARWPDGPGKYLTVYRRTLDGWKIVADTWSHDAPPSAPAP